MQTSRSKDSEGASALRQAAERTRGGVNGTKSPDPCKEGLVFNIQKFSIDDGPGIRTTVFLKGCPLRCPWCSNPESNNPYPEVITKFDALCTHCGRCQEVCATGAITVNESLPPGENVLPEQIRILDRELCERCLKCAQVCPSRALSVAGEKKMVAEVIEAVEQDRPFYRNSGGGITLSGGEPLMQPHFTLALLRESKQRGLHTILDTSGHASRDVLEAALPYLDLVLYDIKHMDPVVHKEVVGVDNRLILENLRLLHGRVPVWIRVPIIPGFNDDERALADIISLAADYSPLKLCFLTYHAWGSGKYAGLGRNYSLSGALGISVSTLEMIAAMCKKAGIRDYTLT